MARSDERFPPSQPSGRLPRSSSQARHRLARSRRFEGFRDALGNSARAEHSRLSLEVEPVRAFWNEVSSGQAEYSSHRFIPDLLAPQRKRLLIRLLWQLLGVAGQRERFDGNLAAMIQAENRSKDVQVERRVSTALNQNDWWLVRTRH